MAELDVEAPQMELTVADIVLTICELEPALKVVQALKNAQDDIASLKEQLVQKENMLKFILKERNQALAILSAKKN